jgi:histidinol-phosphate phosphatase family protein
MNSFILFDRDGTLIEHVHHLHQISDVTFVPGLFETLASLSRTKYRFGIVTNQSVIGRGITSRSGVERIHDYISNEVHARTGVAFDFIRTCPHLAESECSCRKPLTGLLRNELQSNSINWSSSFMIGDSNSDMQFGKNLGVNTIQLILDSRSTAISDFADHIIYEFWEILNIVSEPSHIC